ncbi:hypothetical protein GOFOIKOB_3610 [Methylobacterium tardum]|uniref:Uncharacterized protein n=1 Tax=Methylobacterium tardum TaxID=374432 RepID=A0AA37WSG9_9HYPH|nr:hypothetical protein [Methylobacterium tardum]URD35481.1 hypothetical protein M6G65_23710 [Methylobacterium tardum]GJE50561.1 hypothetical protein GOFOIKOB_3610 [Methylobacterium tardum]GLS69193.1 hypothetical protein GCM10007890_12050 [Methylobacterium tardum]
MIAALFALAAAMIIGGCAAVIQGFPYVRLESGLAMVIAGSVAASSGAVLLGLGVLALAFRRVERAIGQVPTSAGRDAAGAASADDSRTRLPPVLPAAPAFIVPSVVEPPFDPERPRIEPSLELRADEIAAPASVPLAAEPPKPVEPEPTPLFPMPPVTRDEPAIAPEPESKPEAPQPARAIAPEDDLFAAPEEPPEPKDEPPSLRPSLDTVPEPDPKPETRTVVGRYASGGNTYVMFEDGSIEAETPRGRFTFASLDELKAFVDGGGESGARGAA